jgi:hypothetical protein
MEDKQFIEKCNKLKRIFRDRFGSLIFRRVKNVEFDPRDVQKILYWIDENDWKEYPTSVALESFSEKEFENNIEMVVPRFTGTTLSFLIRKERDNCSNTVYFSSQQYYELDPLTFTLVRTPVFSPPRPNDLICGYVENDVFQAWFKCSEQFLHCWTAICFDYHISFNKNKKPFKEQEFRTWYFSSNRLATNSYKKFMLANLTNGKQPTCEEQRERFKKYRFERVAIDWIHIYCFLVLILRYHELPNKINVPKNFDGKENLNFWHLPSFCVERLFSILY